MSFTRIVLTVAMVTFFCGLVLFGIALMLFPTQAESMGQKVQVVLIVLSSISLPWAIYNGVCSAFTGILLRILKFVKTSQCLAVGTINSSGISIMSVVLLLREQENADSVSLGLKETMLGVPQFVWLFLVLAVVGVAQGYVYAKILQALKREDEGGG